MIGKYNIPKTSFTKKIEPFKNALFTNSVDEFAFSEPYFIKRYYSFHKMSGFLIFVINDRISNFYEPIVYIHCLGKKFDFFSSVPN